jgi:hypothetical protein
VRDVVVPRVAAGRAPSGQVTGRVRHHRADSGGITDDVDKAGALLRTGIARSGGQPFYRREYLNAGFREEVAEMDASRARGGDPAEAVSDRLAVAEYQDLCVKIDGRWPYEERLVKVLLEGPGTMRRKP